MKTRGLRKVPSGDGKEGLKSRFCMFPFYQVLDLDLDFFFRLVF